MFVDLFELIQIHCCKKGDLTFAVSDHLFEGSVLGARCPFYCAPVEEVRHESKLNITPGVESRGGISKINFSFSVGKLMIKSGTARHGRIC